MAVAGSDPGASDATVQERDFTAAQRHDRTIEAFTADQPQHAGF
jgi:hypothetical protein